MLLLTSNPRKYEPLADVLADMQISLRKPDFELPELQDLDFEAVVAHKAKTAAEALGKPCLVDDAGVLLDAYPGFPGPLTGNVVRALGAAGIERLLAGATDRARMVCHIGCWIDGRLWHWQGEVAGRIDLHRPGTMYSWSAEGPGPLTQWFVPDGPGPSDGYQHRRRALAALGRDIDSLRRHLEAAPGDDALPPGACSRECVFCQEFDGCGNSIYHEMLGQDIPSRVVHRTEHFLVFPPLGQFIEGGLLLATRDHQISMATLPEAYYADLDAPDGGNLRSAGGALRDAGRCCSSMPRPHPATRAPAAWITPI